MFVTKLIGDGFPKEMLQVKKSRLEQNISDLHSEQADIPSHPQTVILSGKQMEHIEIFWIQVQRGLENATSEQKRQLIDMLDVRGTLAIENEEKVV